MAATPQLPALPDEKSYAPQISGFKAKVETLTKRPLSLQTRQLALAVDTEAKDFLAALENQRKDLKAPVLDAGRKLDAFFDRMSRPAKEARSWCGRLIATYDTRERERIAEANRRQAELDAQRAQSQRDADVAHLIDTAAMTNDDTLLDAAAQLEAAPLEIASTPALQYEPLKDGSVTSETKVGEVVDLYALVTWLCKSKERFDVLFCDIFGGGAIRQSRLDYHARQGVPFPADAVKITVVGKFSNRVKAE